jgi:hypothetical protein
MITAQSPDLVGGTNRDDPIFITVAGIIGGLSKVVYLLADVPECGRSRGA